MSSSMTVSCTHPRPLWMSESVALGCPPHGVEHSAYPSAGHTLIPTVPYLSPLSAPWTAVLPTGSASNDGCTKSVAFSVPQSRSFANDTASDRNATGSALEIASSLKMEQNRSVPQFG